MAWRCNNNFGGTSMKAWIEKTNIQKEINKIFDSNDTLSNIQNKVLELVNGGLYFNFGKFDASCKDGKWTLHLPVNATSGNKLRKENARYEYVGTITFDKNNPFKVKTFYITDKKETNP